MRVVFLCRWCLLVLRQQVLLLMCRRLSCVWVCFYMALNRIQVVLVEWCTNFLLCHRNQLMPTGLCPPGSGWGCSLVGFGRMCSILLAHRSFDRLLHL